MMVLRAVCQGAALHCHDPSYGWLWLNVFMIMVSIVILTETFFWAPNDVIFTLFATAVIMFSLYAPAVATYPGIQRRTPARGAMREL
ncbi:hypothetical protein JJB09_16865 [Rhizobium sp. KVB221]|uniref:Uncharacterized protein n=1 Tax=Rhizobium setariae TaxID=2801340 RepID=A0A936YS01_9HYPH|nr:hypothetical protein [Rhizobium setariae]MBL0373697.1 hypothetical protein [Rhizobium setariae]